MTVEEQNTVPECISALDSIYCDAPVEDHACECVDSSSQSVQEMLEVTVPAESNEEQDKLDLIDSVIDSAVKPQQVLLELGWEPEHKIYCLNYTFPQSGNCRINMTLLEMRNLRNELNCLIDSTTSNA